MLDPENYVELSNKALVDDIDVGCNIWSIVRDLIKRVENLEGVIK